MRDLPDPKKPGRNEPCPCGSGRKWKRCCGDEVARHNAAVAAEADRDRRLREERLAREEAEAKLAEECVSNPRKPVMALRRNPDGSTSEIRADLPEPPRRRTLAGSRAAAILAMAALAYMPGPLAEPPPAPREPWRRR